MAERRMFAKTIIDSDSFIEMPPTSQCLYFHLAMRADDDGFINNPKKILRMIGAKEDDLKLLIIKKFIIPFDSGIVVIKHWKIHNYIRNDRYKPTIYTKEKELLEVKENNGYDIKNNFGIPNGYQMDTQVRLGKDSIGKNSIDIYSPAKAEPNIPFKEICEHLNKLTNSNYRSSSKKTQELIKARFNEGYTLDDFKIVIEKKCVEWMNTDMQKYLRPETLFGTKFEGYLNQQVHIKELTTKDLEFDITQVFKKG